MTAKPELPDVIYATMFAPEAIESLGYKFGDWSEKPTEQRKTQYKYALVTRAEAPATQADGHDVEICSGLKVFMTAEQIIKWSKRRLLPSTDDSPTTTPTNPVQDADAKCSSTDEFSSGANNECKSRDGGQPTLTERIEGLRVEVAAVYGADARVPSADHLTTKAWNAALDAVLEVMGGG